MSSSAPMPSRILIDGLLLCSVVCVGWRPLLAQEEPSHSVPAQETAAELHGLEGPADANLGTVAQLKIPAGMDFLGADDAAEFLERNGNPSSKRELGLVRCAASKWFVVFEYSDDGHVKDDDKNELDADAILESLRQGNDNANELRKQRGWAELTLLGWAQKPHYDPLTKNLEWATRGESEGVQGINHNTRILGRTGVMEVTLVCDADKLDAVLPEYKTFLSGFEYKSGQGYAEYTAGDKLAKYGLTALVVGGAGVLAAKTGLLAKLWKFLLLGVVAVVGFVKRLFGKKSKPAETA